ncbi:hypothetical protein [Solirubrum puertoriconensis]|uniref:Uncharacterized protein n=1 Tax=Solirubrum puertoriconensis TaxID=1751427 RepID=A0A9X0L3T9_SOLP1|nr:hypothetical protein [Solirubrum puertoriconensis]KUG06893.1 hypothetical protein ASU33_06090 [Solirubrum puertoriconensis]
MLTVTLTTATGQPLRQVPVPTSWADVTLAQYLRLVTEPDTPPMSILTGLSMEEIDSLAVQDGLRLSTVLGSLGSDTQLLNRQESEGLPDVGSSSYGLHILAMQHLQALDGKAEILAAPYLYALYRSHQLYGKHDAQKLEQMRQAVLGSPVTEVWPDVVFIYGGWLLLTSATPPAPVTTTPKTTTGSKPAGKIWQRVSARFFRSTPSPTACA